MVDFNKLLKDRQLAKQLRTERLHRMASPTKPRFNAVADTDTNTEDISDTAETHKGFTADDLPETPSNGTSNQQGMSMEELDDVEFDTERDEQTRKLMTLPRGDWVKEDRWEFAGKVVFNQDSQPGDIDPAGRTIFSFTGKPNPRTENGISYQPQLRIQVSPDYRPKLEFETKKIIEGQPDPKHAMYMKAKEVYLAIHNEELKRPRQLLYFFCEDRFAVTTMNGDNGVMPTAVKLHPEDRKKKRG